MKKINITTEHIQFAKNKALGVLFSELPTDSNLLTPVEQWEKFESQYKIGEEVHGFQVSEDYENFSNEKLLELATDMVALQMEILEEFNSEKEGGDEIHDW